MDEKKRLKAEECLNSYDFKQFVQFETGNWVKKTTNEDCKREVLSKIVYLENKHDKETFGVIFNVEFKNDQVESFYALAFDGNRLECSCHTQNIFCSESQCIGF